ncbi:hypothetical protein PybrP1_009528 [[Pythium] brassicae (nom. inval.)]|nr:hypothetical protein PybrP1_009528 [[Pythium] brassicae (nom. inval.)]
MASVWSEHFTKEGRVYYYNRSTKQSSWEKPADFDGEAAATGGGADEKRASAKTAVEWEELWDPKNERAYYYNRATRKTQWLRPEGVKIKPYGGGAAAAAGAKKTGDSKRAAAASAKSDVAKSSSSAAAKSADTSTDKTTPSSQKDVDAQKDDGGGHANGTQSAGAAADHEDAGAAHSKKRKKAKGKRDKSESATSAAVAAAAAAAADSNGATARKKKHPRRESETRMIICDDDDDQMLQRRRAIEEKDTEDGKEATRLLAQLSTPDAIMEANVLPAINGFLRAHNESNGPEILVEALSSSYRGHAQMVALVASWLDAFPVSASVLENKVTYDVSEGAVHESKGGASWDLSEDILYAHLKALVTQHYEPKLTHKTCTLLQYAIRRISDAGHHKEIASITNANAFFTVFSGVLVDAFCRIPFASEEEAREDIAALTKICCQSAYSYVYAEELLCTIDSQLYALQKTLDARSSESLRYRTARSKLSRVRSELQETAIGWYGAKVGFFHPLRRRYMLDANPRLSDAVLSIMTSRKCSESAAETLVKEYKTKMPPPAAHLRDPIVLRSLLDPLFNPSESISAHFADNCISLLAYAASTRDERSILQPSESKATFHVDVDEDGIQQTKTALSEASAICKSDNTLGYNMNQSGVVERLTAAMRVPVVSMGVLHWLEVTLTSPAFFNSTLLHICFPSLLFILEASIKLHTSQWPIAFRVLVTSLRLHPDVNPVKALELKRESLRSMVFMVTSGYVLPVLEFVYLNTVELDQALLRNFVTMLFVRVAPPYSSKFVGALAKILMHPKVQNAVKSCPQEFKAKFREFVGYCRKNPSTLPPEQLQALVLMHEKSDTS